MIRIPGKIPIIIHPTFWIFAVLLSFLASGGSLIGTLIWLGVIVFSLLFHEFGHALTSLSFGQKPRIELVALGGITYPEGPKLSYPKEFLVVFAGPFAGFLLFLIAAFLERIPFFATGLVGGIRAIFEMINFFWTIVNLVPVLPLDGGQLLRIVFEAIFGIKGLRYSLMVGAIIALLVSLTFFLIQQFLVGAIFFLFAFQSFDLWRKSRSMAEPDRDETVKKDFEMAEDYLRMGKKEEAANLFEKVREESHKGLLYNAASQYLGMIKADLGDPKGAYLLLLPLKKELPPDLLVLLHRLAFEEKNYPLVVEIGGVCFQEYPSKEVALQTAEACAVLGKVTEAIGWLETAIDEGVENLTPILSSKLFDPIRQHPDFQEFIKALKS